MARKWPRTIETHKLRDQLHRASYPARKPLHEKIDDHVKPHPGAIRSGKADNNGARKRDELNRSCYYGPSETRMVVSAIVIAIMNASPIPATTWNEISTLYSRRKPFHEICPCRCTSE
jgi:hypothetical protein